MTPSDSDSDRATPRPAGRSRSDSEELWSGLDTAWIVMTEFVTAVLVWGGIGWLFDRWMGTAPWLMVTGFVIGNAKGLYLAFLRSEHAEAKRSRNA